MQPEVLVSTRELFSAVDIGRKKQLILLLQMGVREGYRVEVMLERCSGIDQGDKGQKSHLEKWEDIPYSSRGVT